MKVPELKFSRVHFSAEGHLKERHEAVILAYGRKYAGVPFDIVFRKHKSKRTNPQNSRHFALMRVGAKSLWEDPGDSYRLHDELAHLYFALPPCPKTGMRRRRRTPNTDTKEFSEFTDWCVMKLIELGADLSDWDHEMERMEAA